MIIVKKKIEVDIHIIKDRYDNINDLLFFDIETTGFSYRKNMIYLIGCTYFVNDEPFIIQWLAESDNDEYALLFEFIKFSKDFSYLIHFNGTSFDIPFITKKAQLYNLTFDVSGYKNIDIYKLVRPCKHIFSLENCKLKTIEQYLDIQRIDPYTGGELINQFVDFLDTGNATLKLNLLQHNEDDLIGLIQVVKILDAIDVYHGLKKQTLSYAIHNIHRDKDRLSIHLSMNAPIPFTYIYTGSNHHVSIEESSILITINLVEEELKFFFENYKDYYYIYSEDQALHKQVAKYIDASNKVKATRETCYIKKRGTFIPLIHSYIVNDEKIFYHSSKDKTKYVLFTDDVINDHMLVSKICNHFLSDL